MQFIAELKEIGYFGRESFDPSPVLKVAKKRLGIDVCRAGGSDQLSTVINGLVRRGVIHFEYSRDPVLHPKDVLDYWRLLLIESEDKESKKSVQTGPASRPV